MKNRSRGLTVRREAPGARAAVAPLVAESRPVSWHTLPASGVLEQLDSRADGLTDEEARARLERYGPNLLQAARPTPAWKILLAQLKSIVVGLLFVAAGVALLTGDPVEALAIFAVLVINTVLGFATELRARRAMEALLRLEVPRATVVRSGQAREIAARELVPGDVIVLEAGQSIPADARLLVATEVRAIEASLTGESLPVEKAADRVLDEATPLPDRENMIYKGTSLATGSARAVVVATGMETELGRIGGLVSGIEEQKTPLERRLDVLGRRLVWVALGVGAVVVGVGWLRGLPLGMVIETGIALAIAAVPEGLPAVSTIALAVGVNRMARRQALVRRLPAVESLGSVTVICTDKTGTLTAGEMMVTTVWTAGREIEITGAGFEPVGEFRVAGERIDPAGDEPLRTALRVGMLANRAGLIERDGRWESRGDPTEAALLVAGHKAGIDRESLSRDWPEVGEVPFSSERRMMATFHTLPTGECVACVKGAPGRIIERSASILTDDGERPLDAGGRAKIEEVNRAYAARGLRVLALATAKVDAASEDSLRDLTFVALVGMMDPPAPGVAETIRAFRGAGIRTLMITGDQQLTAEAIGRELGILDADQEVVGGREFERLSDEELTARIGRIGAFSRVSPEAKLRIVDALRGQGEITAMLGDGVNDAAALKRADVGVAMGIRGTDVAKEAAAVVLQDDRFATIGHAVEEGRVIFDNIRKFVFYLFSCNLAEVFVLLVAGVAGLPQPLLPLQILWLNIVTDTFPALALAMEPGESDVMRRPPRDPQRAILSAPFLRSIGFYSFMITVVTLAIFVWGLAGGGEERAMTLAFLTLALAQVFHLGNARSTDPVTTLERVRSNPYALGAAVLVIGLQVLAIHLPPLAGVLGLVPISATDWLVAAGLAALPAIVGQALKVRRASTRAAEG